MNIQRKLKIRGIVMLVTFFILLTIIFSPVFPGKVNGLVFMDNLFNTISKGSVDFIPGLQKTSSTYSGTLLDVTISFKDKLRAERVTAMLEKAGCTTHQSGTEIAVQGNMSAILKNSLNDCSNMFSNKEELVKERYGFSGKQALYDWWLTFGEFTTNLNKQKKFQEAKVFRNINKKAVEPAYNYYGIDSGDYTEYLFLIVSALVFYVIYTLWYGFGIMFLFEGLGLKISN